MNDFKIPRDPVIEDWENAHYIHPHEFIDKVVIFRLIDLIDDYSGKDKDWLEINIKEKRACISREGIGYEPHFIGIIRNIGDVF